MLFFELALGLLLTINVNGVLAYTWPDPQAEKLDDLMYGGILDFFIESCRPDENNKNVAAEWIRFAYHDAATHDISDGSGGIDASLFFELDRPENVGSGMAESGLQFLSVTSKYISRADAIAAALILAVSECKGPQIPFRSGRIDAQAAGPPGVPQPQDSLDSLTSAFQRQGFNPSEMIALVACGHTVGGIRNPDFPTVVPPSANGAQHIVSFDTTPTFDNAVVTEYLNNTTPNLLVMSPNQTMTSDLRVFTSDNNVTMQGMMSPSNFSDTCGRLLERLANTVPAEVVLSDVVTPLEVRVQDFSLVPVNKDSLTLSLELRLLQRPSVNAVVTIFWDALGEPCPTCSAPAFRLVASPTDQLTALGYHAVAALFNSVTISAITPLTKFWFQVDKNDGSEPAILNNGGAGYAVASVYFLLVGSLTFVRSSGSQLIGNVTVAVPADSDASDISGSAFQMSPTAVNNTAFPLAPTNTTLDFVVNTWSTPLPGWTLYTSSIPVMGGSNLDLDLFATVDGVSLSMVGRTLNL